MQRNAVRQYLNGRTEQSSNTLIISAERRN